jgi:hypothetical protein
MFRDAMTINHIVIDGKQINVHNSDIDYGIINQYLLDKDSGKTEFTLSKKDYQTLSMLSDFDLKVKDSKIHIKTQNGNILLANMKEEKIPDTSLGDNAIQLNVKPCDFTAGEKFVGNDKARIQLNGVNITPSGYLISNSKCIYMRKAETGAAEPICVPKEAFKYISSAETCMTDGKRAAFIGPQGIFYISLIVVAMDMPKLDTKQICAAAVDKKQFIDTLKMLRGYSSEVQMIFNVGLHLLAKSETNEFDIVVKSELAKGSKLNVKLYIDDVLKIVELEEENQIVLSFNDRMMIFNKDETTAVCAYINQPDREVV